MFLIAGESWTVHSIHQKGFDSFTTTEYAEGVRWLRQALEDGGWQVTYQPAHVAATDFPSTVEELNAYDCVIISDVGANTFLLHPETFTKSVPAPDRLAVLRDWVHGGGGVIMVGGYLTFQGIDAKARYAGTAIEDALPVTMHPYDDRAERPAGVTPASRFRSTRRSAASPAPGRTCSATTWCSRARRPTWSSPSTPTRSWWPGTTGRGRGLAFTSDCGPHWAPPTFVDWDGYAPLCQSLADWAARELRMNAATGPLNGAAWSAGQVVGRVSPRCRGIFHVGL